MFKNNLIVWPLIILWIAVPFVAAQDSKNTSASSSSSVQERPQPEASDADAQNLPFVGPQPSIRTAYPNVNAGYQSGAAMGSGQMLSSKPSTSSSFSLDKEAISMHWAIQWVLGLGAVILLIYGLAYLLKNHYRPLTMTKHLKAIAWLSVGQRERVAIIQAGNKQYLIGITNEKITAIDSIDPPIQEDSVTAFADHLPNWWKKNTQ